MTVSFVSLAAFDHPKKKTAGVAWIFREDGRGKKCLNITVEDNTRPLLQVASSEVPSGEKERKTCRGCDCYHQWMGQDCRKCPENSERITFCCRFIYSFCLVKSPPKIAMKFLWKKMMIADFLDDSDIPKALKLVKNRTNLRCFLSTDRFHQRFAIEIRNKGLSVFTLPLPINPKTYKITLL